MEGLSLRRTGREDIDMKDKELSFASAEPEEPVVFIIIVKICGSSHSFIHVYSKTL